MYTELIGIAGSVFVLLSITIKTTTSQGNLIMRIINLVGSMIFVAYGMMIPAYSTVLLNIVSAIINIVYIAQLYKELNMQKMDP
jgi:hypothetical protein